MCTLCNSIFQSFSLNVVDLTLPLSTGPDIAADAQTVALVQVMASSQSSSGDRSGASEGGCAYLSGSYILSGCFSPVGTYSCASIIKIRQQTVLYSDSIPLAIITWIRIITHYYLLLRIFLQKCCFMMSFVLFTHYYVLMMLISTYYRPPRKWVSRHCLEAGDPFSGRSIIGRYKR